MKAWIEAKLEQFEGILMFLYLALLVSVFCLAFYGTYRTIGMGILGILLTVVIFINTGIAAHVTTAYMAPMTFLSNKVAAIAVWWYGFSMFLLMFCAAGWGLFLLILR